MYNRIRGPYYCAFLLLVAVTPLRGQEWSGVGATGQRGARFSLSNPGGYALFHQEAPRAPLFGSGDRPALALGPLPGGSGDAPSQRPYPLPFEGYDPEHTNVRVWNAVAVGAAVAGTVTAIHVYQLNAWWKDQRGPFHIVEDGAYALNVDKAGHYLGGAFAAFLGKKSLELSGVSRDGAAIWGGVMGAMFELYIEFEDGFARDWGFSPGDAIGDLIGAGWTVGQHFIPYLEYFQPKFTYYPSKKMRAGLHNGNFSDDYEGQSMWMGIHVHGLLPDAWKAWWPEWLGIAVGVSIRNMDDWTGPQRHSPERNILLALDYDFTKIIPGDSWWMRSFKEGLNFLHFPSPAIRISPGYIAYGLYW